MWKTDKESVGTIHQRSGCGQRFRVFMIVRYRITDLPALEFGCYCIKSGVELLEDRHLKTKSIENLTAEKEY